MEVDAHYFEVCQVKGERLWTELLTRALGREDKDDYGTLSRCSARGVTARRRSFVFMEMGNFSEGRSGQL